MNEDTTSTNLNSDPDQGQPAADQNADQNIAPPAVKEFVQSVELTNSEYDQNYPKKSIWSAHQGFSHAVRYLEKPKEYAVRTARMQKCPSIIILTIARHIQVRSRSYNKRRGRYSSWRVLRRQCQAIVFKDQLMDPYIWNLTTAHELIREIHDDLRARPKGHKRESKFKQQQAVIHEAV